MNEKMIAGTEGFSKKDSCPLDLDTGSAQGLASVIANYVRSHDGEIDNRDLKDYVLDIVSEKADELIGTDKAEEKSAEHVSADFFSFSARCSYRKFYQRFNVLKRIANVYLLN